MSEGRKSLRDRVPAGVRKSIAVTRAKLFESVGSRRYSRPALNQLDTKLLSYLPDGPGVFLEVGANDGYSQSNTYYLERWLGWHGILIEPHPDAFGRCAKLRKNSYCVQAACVADAIATPFVELVGMDLMSITVGSQDTDAENRRLQSGGRYADGGRLSVPARRISEIIDESPHQSITLMSVDVEGAEYVLLQGLDLPRHCPDFLLVETADADRVAKILEPWMTLKDKLSHHDYLFVRA
ncbi:MAG: FkbM family methyltransferase [Actinomycetia bacterium]|nr:FkbM family methyltransferase [Actinomycetes bacterium]